RDRKGYDDESDSAGTPANSAHKRRIEPHSKLIERESDAETVQQRDPPGRARAFENQSEIPGCGEDKNSVDVVVDVQSGHRFPMNSREEKTEEPRTGNRHCKCKSHKNCRPFRFHDGNYIKRRAASAACDGRGSCVQLEWW